MSPARERLRVLIADDHPLLREAVALAIRSRAELELVGEAANGREALAAIRAAAPDVAVVDVQMPLFDGLGVLNAVVRDKLPTRVLLLTAHVEAASVYGAIGAGAAGYLSKDADADALCDAIVAVGRGETVLSPAIQGVVSEEIRARSVQERPLLTAREQEILVLVAAGLSAPAVAERLVLSPATVRSHLQHIYEKLGVSDRAAAVAEGMRRGLLE